VAHIRRLPSGNFNAVVRLPNGKRKSITDPLKPCHSGLRSGELAGLDVGAVDFDRGLIHVGQVMTKFGLRPYPKSDSSRRSAPVHREALDLLWPVVADRSADDPAFPAPRGGRLDQSNFLKTVWHPALKRAGIEPVRAYVTRHTFASWMIQAGVPEWDIAQALGHRTTSFVHRYAFLKPDAHESIRAAWARVGDAQTTQPLTCRYAFDLH
jgi:integrase